MKNFLLVFLCICGVYTLNSKQLNIKHETRIIDGVPATDKDFPWQVALDIRDDTNAGRCGGALISSTVVLTAAHCFDYAKTGWAAFGSTQYMKGQRISFSKIKIHEDYDTKKITNDIALIYLDQSVTLNDKVKIIDLDNTEVSDNTPVTVSGFGKVSDSQHTKFLYYAQLTTVPLSQCKNQYGDLPSTAMCCKGKALESTCTGDSGGPLVKGWPENPKHIGVVSFGGNTCVEGLPVVYTRTAKYIDWIKKNSA